MAVVYSIHYCGHQNAYIKVYHDYHPGSGLRKINPNECFLDIRKSSPWLYIKYAPVHPSVFGRASG